MCPASHWMEYDPPTVEKLCTCGKYAVFGACPEFPLTTV